MFNFCLLIFLSLSIFSLANPNLFPVFRHFIPVHTQPSDTVSEWTEPQIIPLELPQNETPGAFHAVTHGKNTYLVFNTKTGLKPKDIYFTYRENHRWTIPENLSESDAPSSNPQIAIDTTTAGNSQAMHVIWSEAIGTPILPRPGGGPPTDVFYATNEGGIWSKPVSLYHTKLPGLQLPEHLTIDKTGTFHLAFVARNDETRKPTMFHMRRAAGSWSSPQTIPDVRYVDMVDLDGEKLLVTYLRPDYDYAKKMSARDVNSVFVQLSLDGGGTWDEPILVHRSGTHPAFAPRFLKGNDGNIHLFWRKSNDESTFSNTVMHSYSKDGISWSQPAQITGDIEGMLLSFDVISDRSGKLYSVFHLGKHSTKSSFRFYYTCYENGSWDKPYTLLPEQRFDFSKAGREAALSVTQDSLQLILLAREKGNDNFGLYRMTRPFSPE